MRHRRPRPGSFRAAVSFAPLTVGAPSFPQQRGGFKEMSRQTRASSALALAAVLPRPAGPSSRRPPWPLPAALRRRPGAHAARHHRRGLAAGPPAHARGRREARHGQQRGHRGAALHAGGQRAGHQAGQGRLRSAAVLHREQELPDRPRAQRVLGRRRRSNTDTTIYDFGASQYLPTGGNLRLDFNNNRTDTNSVFSTFNPSFGSILNANLSAAAAAGLQDRLHPPPDHAWPRRTGRSPTCSSARPWSTPWPT